MCRGLGRSRCRIGGIGRASRGTPRCGPDVASAARAVATAAAAGIVLQIGYNRRFDRNFAALRAAVAAGRVGRPLIIRVTARDPEPPPRSYLEHTPGLFVDTTSHDLDL